MSGVQTWRLRGGAAATGRIQRTGAGGCRARSLARRGFTLVELLLGMTLLGIVATAAAAVFRSTERAAVRHMELVEGTETLRIAAAVLGAELRYLDPSSDVAAVAGDSLAIRAFRGTAVVCADSAEADVAVVSYRGVREPDTEKDSVVVVGAKTALALTASGAGGDTCGAGAGQRIYRWTLSGSAPPLGSALLLFERGSYHLTGGALRYRRGLGGRQPLTPERIDDLQSGISAVADDGTRTDPEDAAAISIGLVLVRRDLRRGAAQRPVLRLRVPLVNAGPALPAGESP